MELVLLTVSRGEMGVGKTKERRGRVKSRNIYKGPTDKDNGEGTVFGSGGLGREEQGRKNGDNCN